MSNTILKVKEYIKNENLISYGDDIVIGVSGGADSICLFHILNSLKKEYNLTLKVVHINHLIRKDAKDDALYVESLCKEENIPFFLFEENIEEKAKEEKMSSETYGRMFRYNVFNQICSANSKIAVAHNKNDKAETFLFNLFRGSGLNGLCSIRNRRDNIIRPILCLSREEIEKYLEERNIKYKIDSTNLENIYTRNKIRNNIISYAKENINGNVVSNISNAINIIEESFNFLEDFVNNFYKRNIIIENEVLKIDINIFNEQKDIIKKMVLLKCLENFIPNNQNISSKHIKEIINICEKPGYKEISLINNLIAYKEFGLLYIKNKDIKKIARESYNVPLTNNITNTCLGKYEITIIKNDRKLDISNNEYIKYFDFDLIKNLTLTTIDNNFIIYTNDSNTPKKLKDFYNSEKIKGDTPIFISDNKVVWVVGQRISDYFKVSESTKKILVIEKILD